MPAIPLMSERTLVKPRFSSAVSTAGFAALNGGLIGFDERFVLGLGLNVGIELALRNGARFGERRVALNVDF